jgi:hypothetical protein
MAVHRSIQVIPSKPWLLTELTKLIRFNSDVVYGINQIIVHNTLHVIGVLLLFGRPDLHQLLLMLLIRSKRLYK